MFSEWACFARVAKATQAARARRSLTALAGVVLLSVGVARASEQAEKVEQMPQVAQAEKVINIPEDDIGIQTLEERQRQQLATRGRFRVFNDFRFTDRLLDSGITFQHHIVDDGGRHWKAVHYDHGNGLAVADVDGDGLYDLFFTNQLGSNELWKNLGGGRFENITEAAGVALADRISVTASFGDIDNDGDPDLYVTTVKMGNVLYENDGKGRFRDISAAAGVDYVGHSSGIAFFDYNGDGRLDFFVVNIGEYTSARTGRGGYFIGYPDAFQSHRKPERSERGILFENKGENRFEDVTEKAGLADDSWSGDASIVDLNLDGRPDLYITNMQGDDHYYENQGGSSFVDRTAELFPKTPWGAMGVKFFDYNNDGRADLVVTDMHSDMAVEVGPESEKLKSIVEDSESFYDGSANNLLGNAFYENLGEGRFRERSDELGVENYWPWGVSVDDLNADGWDDVFIAASMNFPFRYGINSVLLNDRGDKFLDSEFILGVEPRADGAVRTPWFELECSGADVGHQYCRGREGRHTVYATLGTRAAAMFDLDDDGDLDIVTAEFNSPPQVLISDLAQRRPVHYLKVELRGMKSNRDGLGAGVTVWAKGRKLWKYHDGKSGYLSHSQLPLYFGLGEVAEIERVEVKWPSGVIQTVPGPIATDSLLEIVEPGESDGEMR